MDIMGLVEVFYDAWDSGDPGRMNEVVPQVFAHDAKIGRPEEPLTTIQDVLPLWLTEIEAWRPQEHIVTNVIKGERSACWEYRWIATHNGLLRTTDGREFPASGKTVENNAAIVAEWDGSKITSFVPLFSNYQDIVRQLEADQSVSPGKV
jgi:hypothetical protein